MGMFKNNHALSHEKKNMKKEFDYFFQKLIGPGRV